MAMDESATFHLHWGWMLLRGVVALALGLFGFAYPGVTLAILTLAWGTYALVDGVLALVFASRARNLDIPAWPSILIGLLGIAVGVITFLRPGVTALTLLFLVGAWAIVLGISELVTAIRLRDRISNEWFLGLAGAVAILFGVFVLVKPIAGAIAIAYAVSWFALTSGVLLVLLAFRMRRFESDLRERRSGPRPPRHVGGSGPAIM